jgi:hypothetical protein
MNIELAKSLRSGGSEGQSHDAAWWKKVIEDLICEFQELIKEGCQWDHSYSVETAPPSFSVWLWSNCDNGAPLAFCWSAVLAGSLVEGNQFVSTIDLFLFHRQTKARVCTMEGRSFLQFSYEVEQASWICLGWMNDEWDEWGDLVFPADEKADE